MAVQKELNSAAQQSIYVPVQAVARHFSVSVPTVWRWTAADRGFPKPVSLSPGCTRWRWADIEAFEAALVSEG